MKESAAHLGRGKGESRPDLNPLTAHCVEWFIDLNNSRDYIVIAGMGGGGFIPRAIDYTVIAAWAQLTGNRPTLWEISALRAMDMSWRNAYDSGQGSKSAAMKYQGLGEYCKGERLEECRKQFGGALEQVCATCPN